MALDQLLDEAFPAEKPAPATSAAPRAPGGSLDSLLNEAFGEAPPKPEPPGLLSRAGSAATSIVTGLLSGGGATLGLKAAGPAIAPGAAAPPKSVALPQAPSEEDLKATRSSAAIPEPKAPPPPPVPIKIGPVPGLAPVVEEARRAPLLEQVAGGPAPSDVFKPPQEPQGMLVRGATAAGLVSPEAAAQRRSEAEFAATSVMRKPEGMSEERWQVRQALDTLNRTTAALPRATADRLTFGVLPALLDTFGIESPKTRAPQSQAEALATGAGELAGFLMGPARASHAMLEGNILKWIGPKAGDAVGTILAKNIATQAANLGIASGLAHLGEEAQADTLADAYREMGQHVKGGAMLGAAFGAVGGVIPSNELLPRAARLGVGLAVIDAVQGTHPLDERALSQKAFDYGLNIAFLWRGQDPQKMQAVLTAEAKARSTKEQPVIPEQVLKSALDKVQGRVVKASPEERATLESDLKALFTQEVGDPATGTTATELRTAREVAEGKTGGPAGPGKPAPAAPPAEPTVTLPGGQPGPQTGPVMILGPTGRPMAAPGPARPPEVPEPLQTAQERAEARARGIARPSAPARQGAATVPTVKPENADRPVAGLTFKDYVDLSGKRWPLTSRDPDFARLRFEFDDMKKGLYEARPGVGGQWAIVNRKTGEEVDHLVGGAKAQLEANRLNAVVTLDAFRTAQVPGPVRMDLPLPAGQRPAPVEFQGLQETGAGKPPMELWGLTQDIPGYPKGSTVGRSTLEALGFTVPKVPAEARVGVRPRDLSAEKAPEPKVEGAAATQQQAERAAIEGPKPSAEPPAQAPIPAPPPRPLLIGKQQEIRVPAGSRYQVQYEVVDAKDMIPSHHPKTFAKNPQYPEGVQNRPYHSDKSEQAKVIRQGQDFEPLFLVSPQPSSGGTPIVAPDSNVVLSGNSRTMSLLRTIGTEAFDRYRAALREMAPALGLRPEALEGVEHPILVRRLVGTDTTPEFYRRFAKETNEGFKKPPQPDEEYLAGERRVEEGAPYRSGEPSGPRPTDARRAGEAEGEFMKSPIPAPPLTQAEPSQVSMVQASGDSSRRETAPSFQMRAGAERERSMAASIPSLTQPTGDVKDLLDMASRTKPGLDAGLLAIAARIDGVDSLGSRVKEEASVIDKMQRKAPKGPATFDDFLGGRLQATSPAALEQAQAAIRAKWPEHTEDDFLERPNAWGYRAIHYTVKGPGGFLMEVQLVPAPIADYQAAKPRGGHTIYSRWKIPPSTHDEVRQATADRAESNARFQEAYDRWRGNTTTVAAEQPAPYQNEGRPPLIPSATEPPPENFEGQTMSLAEAGGKGIVRAARDFTMRVLGGVSEPERPYGSTFTSALERAITDKMPERATPEQVAAIAKSPGVKADEVKWTGLDDWLAEQKGPVTKAQVQAFLRENAVRVEETVLGAGQAEVPTQRAAEIQGQIDTLEQERNQIDEQAGGFERRSTVDRERIRRIDDEMERLGQNLGRALRQPDTEKYGKYTLPGGQNYRELLLTLSGKGGNTNEALAQRWFQKPYAELAPSERDFVIREAKTEPPAGEYRSPHWDEPNILASVRFNDRVDKDGKRVLFLEEIQSDWHQEGRRKGYKTTGDAQRLAELTKEHESLQRDARMLTITPEALARKEKAVERLGQIVDEMNAIHDREPGVPEAPFAKTWHELAMKRMLRWAAEHGYDRIAWTTGEQQAERYDLSKQVKAVEWSPKFGSIRVEMPNGAYQFLAESGVKTEADLERYVGKGPAQRLMKAEASSMRGGVVAALPIGRPPAEELWKRIEGADLKVGGEGMKGFYDQILPAFAAKYGKKWGATVGETTVPSEKLPPDKPHGVWRPADVQVHSIDVTPEMRRSVLIEGQALFDKNSPYGSSPVKARKGATTADRESAQMALFDLEQTAKQPEPTIGKKLRGEEAGAGVRTVQRFIDEIKDKGFMDFRGQTVESAQDLAVMGQILRDPRYETFRMVYLKGNEIVGMEAMTSRLPGTATFVEGPAPTARGMTEADAAVAEYRVRTAKAYEGMRDRMRRLGADGYYMMHNHPSGRPEPSSGDMDLTEAFAQRVRGFRGHVIIDSGQYGLIEMKAEGQMAMGQPLPDRPVAMIRELPGKGRALVTEQHRKDDEYLSRIRHEITNPEQLAFFGKSLQVPENAVALIYRDSAGYIRAVQEMPRGLFMRPKEMADFLRGQQRAFGARDVMAWFKPDAGTLNQAKEYIASGVLMDAMAPGWTKAESLKANAGFLRARETMGTMRGIRVQEGEAPYGEFDRLPEETRKKLVEYGRGVLADGKTDFASWAKAIRDKVGGGVSGSLPGAWAALMQETARIQAKGRGGKPPEPPTDIPQSAKPIEPAPGLTEPQLKLGVHKDVLAAAEDLFKAGKLIRDPKMLLSDQILDAIREGNLRIEEMAGVLDKHGMTFSEFGQSMFRPAITDAARRLAALSTLQKRIRDLEVELGGPEPRGGKPGGPGEGERLEKVKTIGDLLDAAKAIDPAAVRALSWWRRADNIRRGLLVTQLATSVRNFTTQVGRLGMDVLDQGLQGALQRAFGKEVTTHPADSFRALMEALSQARPSKHKAVKARVDAILEGLPREQERLFGTYASDLTTAAKKQRAEGAVDAALRGGERAVELLNTVNRFQEYVVRRSVFQAELAARLRAREIDLEEAIAKPEVRRQIPVADIRTAIEKALEITFAENPAYGSPGYHFVKWVNQTPGLTFLTPFPRFMVNSLKFFYEFSPLGFTKLLSEVERQKVRQGDMQTISRATLGLGLLGTAYLIRAMQEDDTKWYEIRLPGMTRTLDTRAYNPFAAYLFVADLIHRSAQGRLYGGGLTAEAVKTFFGANVRGGTGLQAVDQLVDGLRDIGDTRALEKYLKGAGGHLISGFLTPLQQLTDVYAEFSPEDQVVRDVKSEPFLGPIKQRFPSTMVEAAGGELAEEKASPTSEEPVRRESPGLRQAFGLTFGKEKNDLEKELDRLQIPYREVLPSQGDPRLDNILARHMGERAEVGNRLVNSSRYQNLGEIAKRIELKDYLMRLRKQAKAKALMDREYRDIAREVKAGTSKERLAEIAKEEKAGLR